MLRRRTVRTLRISPAPSVGNRSRTLLLQLQGHHGVDGKILNVENCQLRNGPFNQPTLWLETKDGKEEHFMLELRKATVLGEDRSVEEARSVILKAWDSVKKRPSMWSSGPMAKS
jgi:hypothetical protein